MTLAERQEEPAGPRVLHDRLETAYFSLARTSPRWFEVRTPKALIGGFAGLDSPTMSRVALLDAPDDGAFEDVLDDAAAFFAARRLPWSVHLTPFSRPATAAAVLRRRGFGVVSELTVMTRSPLAGPPVARADHAAVAVREVAPDEIARFTAHVIDAFHLPPRFQPGIQDVNRAWIEAGGRAYFAIIGEQVVGTALLTRHDGVAGVYNVATLRPWRGRGVATALMRRIALDHRALPERTLTLQVARGSMAESFYERLGFMPRYSWTLYAKDD